MNVSKSEKMHLQNFNEKYRLLKSKEIDILRTIHMIIVKEEFLKTLTKYRITKE